MIATRIHALGGGAGRVMAGFCLALLGCNSILAKDTSSAPVIYAQKTLHLEGDVKAPIDATWKLVTNWGGILVWYHSVPYPSLYPLIECPLVPGQTEQQLPRTRRCKVDVKKLGGVVPPEVTDPNFVFPESVEETLLAQNDKAHYLIYDYAGNFHPGSTTIQMVEQGPCLTHLIIKYTTLEDVGGKSAVAGAAAQDDIGDAFGPKADYAGIKYYLEKQWAGRVPCK